MSRLRTLRHLAAAVPLVVLLASCGQSGPSPSPDSAEAEEPAPDPDAPGVHRTGPDRFTAIIYSTQGVYDPDEITVPAGSEVTFRLITDDEMIHGLAIEGTDVEISTSPPEDAEATHTFDQPGEYPFVCHIYCGGGHDIMRGKVVVE